jgi:hypothetical protein
VIKVTAETVQYQDGKILASGHVDVNTTMQLWSFRPVVMKVKIPNRFKRVRMHLCSLVVSDLNGGVPGTWTAQDTDSYERQLGLIP